MFGETIFYQTRMQLIFYIISRLRAMFSLCPNKESRKYLTFSKYFRPLHMLVQAADTLQTIDNRQNSKITTDRHFLELSETCLYMVLFLEVAKIVGTQGQVSSISDVTLLRGEVSPSVTRHTFFFEGMYGNCGTQEGGCKKMPNFV